MAMKAMMVPLSKIVESPFHHRTSWGDMEALTASVAQHGVQSPLKARPIGEHFELVFGHRRFRAAKGAKLAEVPLLVEALDDREAAIIQTIENGQREDVSALDEADDYRLLRDIHKMTADDVAAKVGKSRAHVYNRLKLCELKDAGRKALIAGKIDATVAILVARLPTEKLQEAFVKEVTSYGENLTYRRAAEIAASRYTLDLKEASFSMKDATLPGPDGVALACIGCTFRSGNIPKETRGEAFKSDTLCTNPDCFQKKVNADAAVKLEKAKKQGLEVVSQKKAASLFERGELTYDARQEWVDLESQVDHKAVGIEQHSAKWMEISRKLPTWGEVVKKDVPPTVAVDDRGVTHQIVARKEALKLWRERMPKDLLKAKEKEKEKAAESREEKEKEKAHRAVRAMTFSVACRMALASKATLGVDPKVARALLMSQGGPRESGYHGEEQVAAVILGTTPVPKLDPVEKLGPEALVQALTVELLAASHDAFVERDSDAEAMLWFDLLKVDVKQAREEAKAAMKAAAAEAKKPAPAKASGTAAKLAKAAAAKKGAA